MRVVTLVPFRGGDPIRDDAWSVVRPHLEDLGWPVLTGDGPGVWNRSAACNAAARDAGDWDVAVVADADTIHEPAAVRLAVDLAHAEQIAVVPWDRRYKLSVEGSRRAATHGIAALTDADVEPRELMAAWNLPSYPTWRCGSTIVIPRSAWEAVGGFDEGFHTWGHEDCANRLALETLVGLTRSPGRIWHLWHPHAAGGLPMNRKRFHRYQQAKGNPARMTALLAKLGVT